MRSMATWVTDSSKANKIPENEIIEPEAGSSMEWFMLRPKTPRIVRCAFTVPLRGWDNVMEKQCKSF